MTSAIGNLLANAIRFSAGGHYHPHRFNATSAMALRIDVADQGSRVSTAAERDRIFEPFYRGLAQPEDGGLPGTGIGLSIVAETVAAHGGTIRLIEPDPDLAQPRRGALFRIDLPHALDD